ncbi:MAG TPA: hypothetical protein VG273_20970 [Bryobacteraceae bacterium]|jgi:hypothetical protein|nr:hypothetical protein [Bryobacteraceae bacterium]
MASPSIRRDLKALRNLINQADLSLALVRNPDSSVSSARESLVAALALSKDLVSRTSVNPLTAGAAALGAKGGSKTAERGPEYFKQIAAMRKNRRGGRPRKDTD